MALYNVTQTEAGAAHIRNAILTTNSLTITHIAIGDGVLPDGSNPAERTQLVHEVKRLPVQSVQEDAGAVRITARLATDSITADIYQREVGLFSGETLVAYGNAGDKSDFIPAAGHNAAVVKLISVRLVVGNLATEYTEIDSSDFVTFDALNTRLDTLIQELEEQGVIHVAAETHFDAESDKAMSGIAVNEAIAADAERIEHLRDYLFEAWYGQLDYPFAARYFDAKAPQPASGGACSSIRAGGYFGRNLDWTFGEQPTIVVHTAAHGGRFATLGVCGAVTGLTDARLMSGVRCDETRIVPFMLVDGVNEKGLCVSVNVVPHNDKGDNSEVLPAVQERMSLCTLMLPRFVLDNFATAQAAVEYLRDYVRLYHPATLIGMDYEQHFLICDAAHSFIVEFVDGELCILDASGNPYITNFHVSGVTFNQDGGVVTPETQTAEETACTANGITEHGSGLERWNIIAAGHATAGTAAGMRELLDTLMYTRSYETSSAPATPRWNTEFVGVRGLRADSPAEDFDDVQHDAGEMYTERTRTDGNTWQTVHSSIYDMASGTLRLVVQEDTAHEYTFALSRYSASIADALDGKQDTLTAGAGISINGGVITNTAPSPDLSPYATKTEVTSALAGKQDTLTFDNAPTQGSTNPVTSGAVYVHTSDSGKHVTMLDKQGWNDAIMCHTYVHSFPLGTANRDANCIVLASKYAPRGYLKGISLRCRGDGTAHGAPFYLGVFERGDGAGNDPATWTFLGASTEAVQEKIGKSSGWSFENLQLVGGREIAFCAMSTPSQGWNTSTPFGLRVSNRPAGDNVSNVDGNALLPQITLSVMVMSGERIVALSDALDGKQDTLTAGAGISINGGVITNTAPSPDLSPYATKTEVTSALAGKQDTLTFDNAPTQGSTNPVTSGAVYNALRASFEVKLPDGNSNTYTKNFLLHSRFAVRGSLKSVSLRCRNSGVAQSSPFYLGVFERGDDAGNDPATWTFLGASTEAMQEQIGSVQTWSFENLQLTGGREIAFCSMTSKTQGWNTSTQFGLRASARPEFDTRTSVNGTANIPDATLRIDANVADYIESLQKRLYIIEPFIHSKNTETT